MKYLERRIPMKSTLARTSLAAVSGLGLVVALACSSSQEGGYPQIDSSAESASSTMGAAASGANAVTSGASGVSGTGTIDLSNATSGTSTTGVNPGPVMSCTPEPDAMGCVGQNFEAEVLTLDIYVVFDLSCSMSCSVDRSGCCRESNNPDPVEEWRIQPVREAMRAFLQDPASGGIGVGLGYFGDNPVAQNDDPQICSLDNYTDATVGIQQLPGAATQLIGELDAAEPQGGTPTHLGLDGACEYVTGWKATNPTHKVVILLVTDGIPEASCDANIQLATDAAENCYADGTGFETYVLGVVANNSNSLDQLNQIAQAGGTEQAYLTDAADVSGSVLEALNAIRADAAIPCDLQIPPPPAGEDLNPALVNVGVCDPQGQIVGTPYMESQAACGTNQGWYYDNPVAPQQIHLCNATCETVNAAGSSLFFNVGCMRTTDVF